MRDMEQRTIDGRRRWERWTVEEAREALSEWRRSGETAAVFAASRGVSVQRLAYWSKRLATTRPMPTAVFTEVEIVAASARHIEIDVGGVRLRVRDDVAPDRLAQIVVALCREAKRC